MNVTQDEPVARLRVPRPASVLLPGTARQPDHRDLRGRHAGSSGVAVEHRLRRGRRPSDHRRHQCRHPASDRVRHVLGVTPTGHRTGCDDRRAAGRRDPHARRRDGCDARGTCTRRGDAHRRRPDRPLAREGRIDGPLHLQVRARRVPRRPRYRDPDVAGREDHEHLGRHGRVDHRCRRDHHEHSRRIARQRGRRRLHDRAAAADEALHPEAAGTADRTRARGRRRLPGRAGGGVGARRDPVGPSELVVPDARLLDLGGPVRHRRGHRRAEHR